MDLDAKFPYGWIFLDGFWAMDEFGMMTIFEFMTHAFRRSIDRNVARYLLLLDLIPDVIFNCHFHLHREQEGVCGPLAQSRSLGIDLCVLDLYSPEVGSGCIITSNRCAPLFIRYWDCYSDRCTSYIQYYKSLV
jgi:hypothetical protein